MPGKQTLQSAVKGEHTGLTQDCKQDNYLRLGKCTPQLLAIGLILPKTTKSFDVAMVFEACYRKSYRSSGISMNDDMGMKSVNSFFWVFPNRTYCFILEVH